MMRFSLRIFRMRGRLHGIQPVPDRPLLPLSGVEKLMLAGGIALVILLYASDVFLMLTV